jgi:hypothetical protein
MSKETGSFESLIRGVSEQVPHDRFIGQHWTQDNMVSDPVRGLARRHGSVMQVEKAATGVTYSAETTADLATYKEFTFFINSVEYTAMYRPGLKVVGSTAPGLIVYNKDTNVILDVLAEAADAAGVVAALDGGVSAITNVAKYVFLAPNNRVPTYESADNVDNTKNLIAGWIRVGNYSRTYTASFIRPDHTKLTASYTTPSSYYQGVLTTSDIAYNDIEYQKKVNDRVYAYQTAVNQWIGTASAAIQPAAIALSLTNALNVAAGSTVASNVGSHIASGSGWIGIELDDGGDGTSVKSVGQEVETTNDLTPLHHPNKFVRIRPRQGTKDGIYYVKAVPKDGVVDGNFKEVSWQEAPGLTVAPVFVTLVAEVIGNNFYIGTNFLSLAVVSGDTAQQTWAPSSSGDLDSQALPQLFGKKITYLGNFQDRLMIVTGSTVAMSRSGDYVNFFRQSALTLPADDPIEVFALGSEGDTITDGVLMDRTLILFGKRQHYAMDGRNAITPTSAYIATQQAYEDSNICPPVGNGNYVFFCQSRDNRLTVQQMQTGDYADSFRSFDITSQLDGYLSGMPRQIVALTSPSMLAIRTSDSANGFWIFNYLDSADQTKRLYDSWSKWEFNPALGAFVGLSGDNGDILSLTLRNTAAGPFWVVDRFSRGANLSNNPYIDSIRSYSNTTGTIRPGWVNEDAAAIVYGSLGGQYKFLGQPLPDYAVLFAATPETATSAAMMGCLYESSFEPTAPYMRDAKEKAILDCTLILGSYNLTLSKSAAVRGYLRGATQDVSQEVAVLDWIYRPAGAWVLNTQQVADIAAVEVDVQQEIREFRLRLASRNWLPLTFSSIEWSGQFFTQRNA